MARVRLPQRHKSGGVPDVKTPLPRVVDQAANEIVKLGQTITQNVKRNAQVVNAINRAQAEAFAPRQMNEVKKAYSKYNADAMSKGTAMYDHNVDKFFTDMRSQLLKAEGVRENRYIKKLVMNQFNSFETEARIRGTQWKRVRQLKDVEDAFIQNVNDMVDGADGNYETFKKNLIDGTTQVDSLTNTLWGPEQSANKKRKLISALAKAHLNESIAKGKANKVQLGRIYKEALQEKIDVATFLSKNMAYSPMINERLINTMQSALDGGANTAQIMKIIDKMPIHRFDTGGQKRKQLKKEVKEFIDKTRKYHRSRKRSRTALITNGTDFVNRFARDFPGSDLIPGMRKRMNESAMRGVEQQQLNEFETFQYRKQATQQAINRITARQDLGVQQKLDALMDLKMTGFGIETVYHTEEQKLKSRHDLELSERIRVEMDVDADEIRPDLARAEKMIQDIYDPKLREVLRNEVKAARKKPEKGASIRQDWEKNQPMNARQKRVLKEQAKELSLKNDISEDRAKAMIMVQRRSGDYKSRWLSKRRRVVKNGKSEMVQYDALNIYRTTLKDMEKDIDLYPSDVQAVVRMYMQNPDEAYVNWRDMVTIGGWLHTLSDKYPEYREKAKFLMDAATHMKQYDQAVEDIERYEHSPKKKEVFD